MSAAEWIPGRWNDVKVGQTVCLRNADGAEVEILIAQQSDLDYPGNWVRSESCRYGADEWELFVHASPLPTTPGVYRDVRGGTWTLAGDGDWFHNGDGTIAADWTTDQLSQANGVLPLTLLEPVSATHERILPSLKEAARGIAKSKMLAGDCTTVDLLGARRVLANLITELEATK